MEISTLVSVLDQPVAAAEHLGSWGVADLPRARQVLVDLAETGLTLDLLARICTQLGQQLSDVSDPDATLAAFGRYLFAVRSPLALAALFERDPTAMPCLLNALSLGTRWTELLCEDPEVFDLVRETAAQPIAGAGLVADVLAEVEALHDERSIVAELARVKSRHLLRIAYGEVHGRWALETTAQQLSELAEALVAVAYAAAVRKLEETKSQPERIERRSIRGCILATAALGGRELDYALPLSLLLIYDIAVRDITQLLAIHEHFERVGRTMLRLLEGAGHDDATLGVQWVSLPDRNPAAMAHALEDVVLGFDSFGRTWHRQELLKARPIAGDLALGEQLLARLEPWLYRRYLGRADESGIKAFKRRILLAATLHQDERSDVRAARGGLRDIEATVEFLQLLAGGDQPAVRQASTLAAIDGLYQSGTITGEECSQLTGSFTFLRQLWHRLQIAGRPQATGLPTEARELAAIGKQWRRSAAPASLSAELAQHLDQSWQTIRKLLLSAFSEEPSTPREVDLLLDPAPPPEEIRAALAPFGFHDPVEALATLHDLATEQVPFLSTRRCRHLLARILPRLLCAIAAAPNPDQTLVNLARVSNSLGGKGVLWDLLHFHPSSLDLYVRLCAASPYLSNILTTNPGMIDELVDSLQLDRLPTKRELEAALAEMCRGASNTLPVLHDFKNAEHLRIGVRDIMGREDIDRTHQALADVAEICLAHVVELEYRRLVERYGIPTIGLGEREGQPSRLVIVALGKLGGCEPNYHSHLDVLFLYEADGTTRPTGKSRREERTANNHFYTQLAQRIIKQLTEHTPKGRLYAIDTLLRPIGVSGALALPLPDFLQHFSSGVAPLWQWQALCQARPVIGDADARDTVSTSIRQLVTERPSRDVDFAELRHSRRALEKGSSPQNLKRASGGTLDVEFLVQMLQLRHTGRHSDVLISNTQTAISALAAAGVLSKDDADKIGESYRFLRRVESGIRLLDTLSRHDLPDDAAQLRQLALLLGHSNPERLRQQCLDCMAANRAVFDRLTG